MDPISAMIGGMFSLGGGLLSSSAQSAANQANIQQAQYQETGAYLPQLIANARKAGINPLAVLPGGGGSANIQPVTGVGSSLGDIGQNLSRMSIMATPHQEMMDHLQERQARAQVENQEMENIKLRHDIGNVTGTPPLGQVHVGTPKEVVRSMIGAKPSERMDFPYNVIGDTANFIWSGGRALNRGVDWIEHQLGY